MAMTTAERTRAYRERQRERMAVDPEYAEKIRTQRREEGRRRRSDSDERERINANARSRHTTRVQEDPDYVEMKRKSGRDFYSRNKDSRLAASKAWAEEHDRSEYNREWSRANPEKRREIERRRRAQKRGAVEVEPFTKAEVWERDQGICGICKENADPLDWHLDHVIPLSKGGQHTFRNVQVSHPRCNMSKKDKII